MLKFCSCRAVEFAFQIIILITVAILLLQVCRLFNDTCQRLLNQGFTRVDKYHGQIQKTIKSRLPRRESERRNHALAKHVNALSAVETRLSLLNMTYMKYIEMQLCSFIPGKVGTVR